MPFLRLTRDRRGIEHTFLLHADHSGGRPRLLYWYRSAPGIMLGRSPLDEEAIRTIEDRHPDIDFDWPALLALREAMTPEDEEAPIPQKRKPRRGRDESPESPPPAAPSRIESQHKPADDADSAPPAADGPRASSGLLEGLVGREIATRLRARYAEIRTMITDRPIDETSREAKLRQANALNPDAWLTAEAVLDGVRNADAIFEHLRDELLGA